MIRRYLSSALVLVVLLLAASAWAGWMDKLKEAGEETGLIESAGLSTEETVEGLKEALRVGVDRAVGFLGQPGGYLNHEDVRIPMPDSLQSAADVARTMGKDEVVDEFVVSMNQAAERAVPEAVDVFTDAIKQMTFDDAKKILKGPDDAATRYFERTSSDDLTARFLPIVDEATDEVGVTRKYKNFTESLGPATSLMDMKALDLDGYVTEKGLDGLFLTLAREEKKIRENPAARTTEILKKVFGSKQ
ncbi:DUF4197 domain-containing protein [Desulfohalovibrio reitneri]|uniref:DUF4197 domain-containing protein n=1 Tax=Desulfohalovibrio reitneri TaxID=1307759 RepID=UPI0004A6DD99|nr:DUF4197 domain-containing protein [Desulfohalovibrio reitneri]